MADSDALRSRIETRSVRINAQDQAFSNTPWSRLVKLINTAMHGVGILLGIPELIQKHCQSGLRTSDCSFCNPSFPALFSRRDSLPRVSVR